MDKQEAEQFEREVNAWEAAYDNLPNDNINESNFTQHEQETHDSKTSKSKKEKFDLASYGGVIIGGSLVLIAVISIFLPKTGLRFSYEKSVNVLERTKELTKELDQKGGNVLKQYTDIIRTLAEANPQIIKDLEEIESQGGLPAQVFRRTIPASKNISTPISSELKQFDDQTYSRLKDCFSTTLAWVPNEELLKENEGLFRSFIPQIDRISDVINSPDAKFEQLLSAKDYGLVPDDFEIQEVWDYVILEECSVAYSLINDNIDDAIMAMLNSLRIADLISHTRFPVMRIQATYMRANALRILQALVNRPDFTREDAIIVRDVLVMQLKNWPADSKCWVTDRAAGIRAYDLIRQGRITDALTPEECDELLKTNLQGETFENTVAKNSMMGKLMFMKAAQIDEDQIFYLNSMRSIIGSCSEPFYDRLPVFTQIDNKIASMFGTKDYLPVAPLLLGGIKDAMQAQAEDKAKVETWILALVKSLGNTIKGDTKDPVQGKPYTINEYPTPEGKIISVICGSNLYKAEIKSFSE
ncbi:MAG: hypothetical protein ACRC2T_17925 [Thermoguttaceae bacterium]